RARATLDLSDGTRIALRDSRALASLTLHDEGGDPLPALGPEPFDVVFTAEWLREVLASRRGAIKAALLDQRVVAGVGNIYAAEALWRARIDPRTPAASLGLARCERLVWA